MRAVILVSIIVYSLGCLFPLQFALYRSFFINQPFSGVNLPLNYIDFTPNTIMDIKVLSEKEADAKLKSAEKSVAAIKKRITIAQGQYSNEEIAKLTGGQVTALLLEQKAAEKEKLAASIHKEAAKAGFVSKEQEVALKDIATDIKKIAKEQEKIKQERGNAVIAAEEFSDALEENRRLVELRDQHQAELEKERRKEIKDQDKVKIAKLEDALDATKAGIKESESKFKEFERRQAGGATGVTAQGAVNLKVLGKDLLGKIAPGLSTAVEGIQSLREYNKKQRQEGKEQLSVGGLVKKKADELTGGMITAITGVKKENVKSDKPTKVESVEKETENKPTVVPSPTTTITIPEEIKEGLDAATDAAIKELEIAAKNGKITEEELKEIKVGILEVVKNTSEIEKAIKEFEKTSAKVGQTEPQVKVQKTRKKIPAQVVKPKAVRSPSTRDAKTGRFIKAPTAIPAPSVPIPTVPTPTAAPTGIISSTVGKVVGGIALAGLAGAGLGTALYQGSETVRDIAGSAMEGIFGHIKTSDELQKEHISSPDYQQKLKDSTAKRLERQKNESDTIKQSVDTIDEKIIAKQNEKIKPPQVTVNVPQQPAANITQRESLTVRNQDNTFARLTERMMSGAYI